MKITPNETFTLTVNRNEMYLIYSGLSDSLDVDFRPDTFKLHKQLAESLDETPYERQRNGGK